MADDTPNDELARRLAEAEAALNAARHHEIALRQSEEPFRDLAKHAPMMMG